MNAATWGLIVVGALELVGVIVTAVLSLKGQKEIAAASQQEMLAQLDKQSELADARMEAKIEKYAAVTDTKIDELTREVRSHNNFAQRVPVMEEQIKVANNRIKDLERITAKA